MARSTIHYLRKRGLTQTAIAAQVGCERRTVARALTQPVEHRYRCRIPLSTWAAWEPAITGWLDAGCP
jgi:transposase